MPHPRGLSELWRSGLFPPYVSYVHTCYCVRGIVGRSSADSIGFGLTFVCRPMSGNLCPSLFLLELYTIHLELVAATVTLPFSPRYRCTPRDWGGKPEGLRREGIGRVWRIMGGGCLALNSVKIRVSGKSLLKIRVADNFPALVLARREQCPAPSVTCRLRNGGVSRGSSLARSSSRSSEKMS